MRYLTLLFLVGGMFFCGALTCEISAASDSTMEPDPFQEYVDSSRRRLFIVETDEDSARSSLDRISGDIDRGFATEEYTYKSRNHGTQGPLEHQKDETLYY